MIHSAADIRFSFYILQAIFLDFTLSQLSLGIVTACGSYQTTKGLCMEVVKNVDKMKSNE